MPKLTQGHLLAETAILKISSILNNAGALTEQIRNDYGEDLLVQTHLENYADNFRLLIQVKGINRRTSGPNLNFRLKVDHLRRWISQSDPVLVCVYDENSRMAYAFSPNARFSLWELSSTDKNSISIKLTERDIFNVDTAKNYIWNCRIEHWSRMLSWYENHINYDFNSGAETSIERINKLNASVIVFSFLKAMMIVDEDKLSKPFRQYFKNAAKNLAKKNAIEFKTSEGAADLRSAVMLAMLGRVYDVCRSGIPSNLLERGTDLCASLLSVWHVNDWARASKLLPDMDGSLFPHTKPSKHSRKISTPKK